MKPTPAVSAHTDKSFISPGHTEGRRRHRLTAATAASPPSARPTLHRRPEWRVQPPWSVAQQEHRPGVVLVNGSNRHHTRARGRAGPRGVAVVAGCRDRQSALQQQAPERICFRAASATTTERQANAVGTCADARVDGNHQARRMGSSIGAGHLAMLDFRLRFVLTAVIVPA